MEEKKIYTKKQAENLSKALNKIRIVGWMEEKFPIRNNINGVPSVSMELCADLFVQTEYGQHYTKSTSYYVP